MYTYMHYVHDVINETQLPWLRTAIYHTGLDAKNEVTMYMYMYTCICLGKVESEGRRRPSERVLNLVLAPGDRIPTLSVLEEEVGGSLEVEI